MKYVRATDIESWLEQAEQDVDDPRDALFFACDEDIEEEGYAAY